jgi:hypothetical protein
MKYLNSLQRKDHAMQILTKVYEDHDVARQVVTELETGGIPSSSISIVANEGGNNQGSTAGGGAEAGLMIGGTAGGLLAGLGAMTIPGIGQVAAAGWLVTMALGAFAGGVTGSILGALIDANVPEEHAHVYSEALRRGASLVSVRVEDKDVELARAIMDRHTSIDPARKREEYRKSGWKHFDPSVSSDYVPESLEVERMRRT